MYLTFDTAQNIIKSHKIDTKDKTEHLELVDLTGDINKLVE